MCSFTDDFPLKGYPASYYNSLCFETFVLCSFKPFNYVVDSYLAVAVSCTIQMQYFTSVMCHVSVVDGEANTRATGPDTAGPGMLPQSVPPATQAQCGSGQY